MKETREFLKSIGMPEGDAYDLPTSEKRFHDGGQYRFEVPGIQSPKVMEALLDEMDKYQISLHRVTQTKGIMMLTDNGNNGNGKTGKGLRNGLDSGNRSKSHNRYKCHSKHPGRC